MFSVSSRSTMRNERGGVIRVGVTEGEVIFQRSSA